MAAIDYAQLAHEVVKEACDQASSQAIYLLKLKAELGRSYHRNSLTQWLKAPADGGTVPGGEVVLASAKMAGIRLDEKLYGESLVDRVDRIEALVRKQLGAATTDT